MSEQDQIEEFMRTKGVNVCEYIPPLHDGNYTNVYHVNADIHTKFERMQEKASFNRKG